MCVHLKMVINVEGTRPGTKGTEDERGSERWKKRLMMGL